MKLFVFKSHESHKKHIYDEFVFRNVVVVNTKHKIDLSEPKGQTNFVIFRIKGITKCEIWKIEFNNDVPEGKIYLNQIQRTYYDLALNDEITVSKYTYSKLPRNLFSGESKKPICVKLSSYSKKMQTESFNNKFSEIVGNIKDVMINHVVIGSQPFCIGYQDFSFKMEIEKNELRTQIDGETVWKITHFNGVEIVYDTKLGTKTFELPIIDYVDLPLISWDLKKEGVGGLKDATQELFRRAFSSRQNPKGALKLGTQHIRGVLLFGPPGCGKTLIARTLAELLSKNVPPKIVSGPEIFDKYVGGSSEKIRNLFVDAERDEKAYGPKSPLHVIILDEFDSIGGKRTNGEGTSSNVANEVVNQLLSKIEGPEVLNNILMIGMTNRKDAIDKALLRPGRFEVHIEIKLPTFDERKEIVEIHCSKMIENGAIDESVDIGQLARKTHNFTGAEINGLIKSAASYALSRTIDINDNDHKISVNNSNPFVTLDDFEKAFNDIKPQFGIQQHRIFANAVNEQFVDENNVENVRVENIIENNLTSVYKTHSIPEFIVLYQTIGIYMNVKYLSEHEKKVGRFALDSNIDCLMCIDYFDMIGMNESQKCLYIKDMYIEASKTSNSLIVIHDANTIIGYNNYNNYFSGPILQTITTLMRYYGNVKTIVTFTVNMKMDDLFDCVINV